MFFGAVPTDCIQQVFKIMDIEDWTDCYVACSGSFRLERALSNVYDDLTIHSNDVSVYSAAVGGLATNKPIDVKFRGRLSFVNELIDLDDPIEAAAAVLVGCEMSRYARGNTEFNKRHFQHYVKHFKMFASTTRTRVEKVLESLRVEEYFGGDWRIHADNSIGERSGLLAFPPFFKGDYEAQFKFIDDNIEWDEPAYDLYDPNDLHSICDDLEEKGAKFCILTDQVWKDREPVIKYQAGRKVPHYCYANTVKTSYMQKSSKAQPFKYKPVDPDAITKDSKVTVTVTDGAKLNFIKDVYLASSIVHSSGFGNYLVWIDGGLVGAIIYDESPTTRAAYGQRTLYLLSDVTITPKLKLSKLVAMIAASHDLIQPLENKMLRRYERIVTTARTKHPVSMKYRGIFNKLSRREDEEAGGFVIQYAADVVDDTPQEIFSKWWKKYGPASNGNSQPAAKPARSSGKKRAVYDSKPTATPDGKHSKRRIADKPSSGVAQAKQKRKA